MIRWGINSNNHGSSIAIFHNEKLTSWKFSKEDELPNDVVRQGLQYGNPDELYWYERPWIKKARQLYAGQYSTAFDLSSLPSRWMKNNNLNNIPVAYTPHHASHAAAGYYTSPFNYAAVVVLDAIGEFECATIWSADNGELRKLWSRSYPNSLGLFYSAFTKLVNLVPIKDEYLFQKMSDNGDPNRFYHEVKKYMGGMVNAHKNMHRGILDWPLEINNIQDQCDIAAAVQEVFTEQVNSVMLTAKYLTNAKSLVYMGGCAMNSKTNKQVVEPMFKYTWSLPMPGDPSSSIGTVLYHNKFKLQDYKWDPVKHIEIRV